MTCRLWSSISARELRFRVFLQMTAGKIERLFLSLQTTHHMAAFKSAGNQGGQFRRIDIGTHLASSFPLLGNRLQTVKPGTESLASFRSQLRIAIVGINCRVQQWAASGTTPARRSRKFRTICLRRFTVFGICSVPSKRVSIASFQA